MRFDIITIFPDFFDSFLKESLIQKGMEEELIQIEVHNLRDYADDPHNTVDDRPFGGGFGMVYKVGPIYKAVKDIKKESDVKKQKIKTILFTPRGKILNQKGVTSFSNFDQLIMICGRYEGVDERVAQHIADEEVSIGNYVLLGGEVPAMAVIESVSRLIPGVIGDPEILDERVTKQGGFIEYEQYTRPRVFQTQKGKEWTVPEVLLSGDHKKIENWRKKHSRNIGES